MDGLIHLMHVPFSLAYLLDRVENAIQFNDVMYTVQVILIKQMQEVSMKSFIHTNTQVSRSQLIRFFRTIIWTVLRI